MKPLLKWPLIVTAIVVIARVLSERSGAPRIVSNALSVLLLTCLICPLYFAIRIALGGEARPYGTFLKANALYAPLARAMIIPTYWLAHVFQWGDARFESVVREGVSPLKAYVLTPLNPFIFLLSIIVGSVCGLVALVVVRLFYQPAEVVSRP
jgi:hypothetical protein